MIAPVRADVQYDASGEDLYRIESAATSSKVSYAGSEGLTVRREGTGLRFEARARYTRSGPDGESRAEARFVQVLHRDGTFEDRVNDDPDFLTILNQPFAVRLDAATLRDLRDLRGRVPFSATSPLGAEAVLRRVSTARCRRPDRRPPDGCGEFRGGGCDDRTAARLCADAGLRKHAHGRLRLLRARQRDARGFKRDVDAEGPARAEPYLGLDSREHHVYSLDTSG